MVNNHGDPKSPKDRVVGTLPNDLNGVTANYLLKWKVGGWFPSVWVSWNPK